MDTICYKDKISQNIYYLTCKSKNIYNDSVYNLDDYCLSGGFFDIYETLIFEFDSDFPHYDDEKTKIIMNICHRKANRISIDIQFDDYNLSINQMNLNKQYVYYLVYNSEEELFIKTGDITMVSQINKQDTITINGKNYTNTYIITYREDDEYNKFAFYDTIYYSKDGFVKFISSQYGYNLERIE